MKLLLGYTTLTILFLERNPNKNPNRDDDSEDGDRDRNRGGGGGDRNPDIEFVDPDLNVDLDHGNLDPYQGAGINPYGTGYDSGFGMRPGGGSSRPGVGG